MDLQTTSNNLTPSEWAVRMLELMTPSMRQRLIRKIMLRLRKVTQANIRAQRSPGGQKWVPRKKAKSKRKMMRGLVKPTHLKLSATDNEGSLGYSGSAARIAEIHHYGLIDNVSRKGPKVKYPSRQLIGVSDETNEQIDQVLVEHYAGL